MTGWLYAYRDQYKKLHQQPTPNASPILLLFIPNHRAFKIPTKQLPVSWNIPANVTYPQTGTNLLFYSIPQLASLIKNKKDQLC